MYRIELFGWHILKLSAGYPQPMAVTLKVRAGKPLKAALNYWQPGMKGDPDGLVDTSSYTARIQLRATQRPGRVLLNAKEYIVLPDTEIPPGTVLRRVEPGSWRLVLSGAITKSLPSSVRFELELANNSDPDDTVPLASGVIMVEPEVVSNA
jgi:hypothetical protein